MKTKEKTRTKEKLKTIDKTRTKDVAQNKKKRKRIVTVLVILAVIALIPLSFDLIVRIKGGKHVKDSVPEDLRADCIIVLGCSVKPDGEPSDMLKDRVLTAVELYRSGAAPKILMSGDHGADGYDEVNIMKAVAIENGVPSEDIFMDHAGFSTYETVYRAKAVFGVRKCVVVTQKYHLYRALFLCDAFDIEAVGISADLRHYYGQLKRDLREVAARCKDLCFSVLKPPPKYLGEPIDITGDGNVTNDKGSFVS